MGRRGKTLLRLLDCLNKNGVACHFVCPVNNDLDLRYIRSDGMQLIKKRIPYKKVLQKTLDSNCILEVLQEGQTGPTLRYLEAVCYNKKLLTTNPGIKDFPFYDDRYMKIFSTEAEIDFDWIKKREVIDYGYTDEFSPVYFFAALESEDPARFTAGRQASCAQS